MAKSWTKSDLVNALGALNGWRRYLEFGALTTGGQYSEIDRSQFTTCHRLSYLCLRPPEDGLPVDFESNTVDIADCIRRIDEQRQRYDVILVDSWHSYDASVRDLAAGYYLLQEGGAMVVHDCLPTSEDQVTPEFHKGLWCGLTYKAYLDFVIKYSPMDYYTLDTDFGCGVIRRTVPPNELLRRAAPRRGAEGPARAPSAESTKSEHDPLVEQWTSLGDDHAAAFRFFRRHFRHLLRLRTTDEFLDIEREAAARAARRRGGKQASPTPRSR